MLIFIDLVLYTLFDSLHLKPQTNHPINKKLKADGTIIDRNNATMR